MKKSKTLDAKDLRILRELENDARKSITSIARKAMVSKDVAIYRIKKLFNEGVIKSIKPIIDTFLLGITTYSIILDLHNLKKNTRKEILENLRSKKNISVNKFLQSDSDLEILIDVKLPGDLYQFYENFLDKYAKFIQKIELSVVTKKHFFGNRYLLNTSNSVILEGTKKFLKIDEKDWDLLEILKKDPRIPVIDIAQKLGISSVSVIRRIRKLKSEGVIRGYLVILDNRAIHRELYKVRVLLRNASHKKGVLNYLKRKLEVTAITELIGSFNLDFEISVENPFELDSFLENFRSDLDFVRDFYVMNIQSQ